MVNNRKVKTLYPVPISKEIRIYVAIYWVPLIRPNKVIIVIKKPNSNSRPVIGGGGGGFIES